LIFTSLTLPFILHQYILHRCHLLKFSSQRAGLQEGNDSGRLQGGSHLLASGRQANAVLASVLAAVAALDGTVAAYSPEAEAIAKSIT
jgi:hypothetical protein